MISFTKLIRYGFVSAMSVILLGACASADRPSLLSTKGGEVYIQRIGQTEKKRKGIATKSNYPRTKKQILIAETRT